MSESVIKRNENRPGYKRTKVGWIPEEWECQSLRRVAYKGLINGLFKRPNEYGSGTLLVNVIDTYGGLAINPNKLDRVRTSLGEIERYANQHGDLFFVRSSLKLEGVGNCGVLLDDQTQSVFECHLIRFRPDLNKVDPLFVAYLCRSSKIRKQMLAFAQTTTMTTLPQNCLEKCLLPIPPLPEQKKIAEILSIWDEAIEQTRKLVDAKKGLKKALMQQLLTGKKRLPGFEKTKDERCYRFFDLPEDWECPQMKEIAQECSERNTMRGDLPVLACSKHLGFIESSEYFGKQVFSEDTSNYKVIRRGCFGFPSNHIEEGSIGLQLRHDIGLVSPIYTVFRCDESVIPQYLYAVFKTDTFRHIFRVSTNASVDRRGSLRWREFSLIYVPKPSREEQQAIVDILQSTDEEINKLEMKLNALENQKRGLMQKLLTGEVRVNI
jgi:type I restriction enzyme S subunit